MEQGVVITQPSAGVSGALEWLRHSEFIKIRQIVDLLEVLTGFQVANKYEVFDKDDRMIMKIFEESEMCERQCCGPLRGFKMHIQDISGVELARVHRRFRHCVGCCLCCCISKCPYEIWVDDAYGNRVAHVVQKKFCTHPELKIMDQNETKIFNVYGPCACFCQGPCCEADLEFPLIDDKGEMAGKITKIWDGVGRGCTNANTFGCHFPPNMDLNKKLAILGCVFEIDFLFFEYQNQGGGAG